MITRRDVVVSLVTGCAVLLVTGVVRSQQPVLGSTAFEWDSVAVKSSATGATRSFFRAATPTLDELEIHATTLNPGAAPHPPHRHPDDELVIVKEGTVEVLVNGKTTRVGPGSVVFQASNQLHGIRNAGPGQATYFVLRWLSPGMKKSAK
jgi:quercetin dioxygenase-like cupin family protein